MFGKLTYLLWLTLYIGLPLLLLLRWHKRLWHHRYALGWTVVGSLVGGWAWDAAAIYFDLWYYDPDHILDLWLLGLPLEEWLWISGVTLMFGSLTIIIAEWMGVVE